MPDSIMPPDVVSSLRRSPEIKNLAAALVKAQAAMEGARKDKSNPHFKSAYADLAAVWDALREPLSSNGLAVVQFPRSRANGIEIETTLLHTSGEFMSDVLWLPAQMTPQGMGSAITYGRRYALMAVAGVAPVDDDGNAATAGMAGGGGQFRPETRAPFAGDTLRQAREEAIKDGLTNGETRSNYDVKKAQQAKQPANGKNTAADKTRRFVDNSIGTLNLGAQTKETLDAFWKSNAEQIQWIADHFPDEHERLVTAFDNARESAGAAA